MLPAFLAACGDSTGPVALPPPPDYSDAHVSITSDPAAFASRVTYYSDVVHVDQVGVGYSRAAAASGLPGGSQMATLAPSLELTAEIAPPSIGGELLQATSVAVRGNLAVVSYAMIGEPYLGGVDVIDITHESRPVLKSQALYKNMDVNAVDVVGSDVLLAGATGDQSLAAPATLELLRLRGSVLAGAASRRAALASYAGTGVTAAGSRVYATSGDGGGLAVLDRNTLSLVRFLPLQDARWVTVASGRIMVAQGTPGRLAVYDEAGLTSLGTFPFQGADVAESKSTVEVAGGKAFLAAGPAGVQVLSTVTGRLLGSVPRPDPTELSLAPSVVVTNAVSAEDDLLFISNGEAGVYLAQGAAAFSSTGSETPQTIRVLGRLRFARLQSANHVAYRAKHLLVAGGLGGLKIVRVK